MTIMLLLSLGCGPAQATISMHLGEQLANGYVRPALNELRAQAQKMAPALTEFCARFDTSSARRVGIQWQGLTRSWARVEFLRFGPLVEGGRFERLAFWPDVRGVMPRQVQSLLKAADPALLEAGVLKTQSVAVQGLPALEYVLYGEPALLRKHIDSKADYACAYALAIVSNIVAVVDELRDAWSDRGAFGIEFAHPMPANDWYRSQQEVAAEAIKAISTGLQFSRDVKLLPVLGDSVQTARSKRAMFWRSQQTFFALGAGLDGLLAFFAAGNFLQSVDAQSVGASAQSEWVTAIALIQQMPASVESAVTQEETRQKLALLRLVLKNLKTIVDQHIAPALGVSIGFNALDGD